MAAPTLRHYKANNGAANVAVNVTGLVAAARALVVSRVTVVNNSAAAIKFSLIVGVNATTAPVGYIVRDMELQPGQVYGETGLVVPAGSGIWEVDNGAAGSITVNVFGEEVDN